MTFHEFMATNFQQFWELTGFANATWQHLVMLAVGLFFLWLAIKKNFEPMWLVSTSYISRYRCHDRLLGPYRQS